MFDEECQGITEALKEFARIGNYIKQIVDPIKEWYNENSKQLRALADTFHEVGVHAATITKLKDYQILLLDSPSLELMESMNASNQPDRLVQIYYFENDDRIMKKVIQRCGESKFILPFSELYSESIAAYYFNHYHLACIGLFAIIDGLISVVSESDSTNFKRRIEIIKGKVYNKIRLSEFDWRLYAIYISLDQLRESFFADAPFRGNEPQNVNRNWILHGRSRKQYQKDDVLKTLLFLNGLIILADLESMPESIELE